MTNGRKRIALFTCYSPEIGGGGANLRSLIPQLVDVEVNWFYLGSNLSSWPNAVGLGRSLMGGPAYRDLVLSPMLWLGLADRWLAPIAKRILQQGFDGHWVVAMNEGILIGSRLAEHAPEIPLHVSVQDDQEFGMFGRSKRYRWLARLTRAPFRRLMRRATSIDVTSDSMQRYYEHTLGVASVVVHPFVAGLPAALPRAAAGETLTVGHIGSIYSSATLAAFLRVLVAYARKKQRALRLIFIGQSRHLERVRLHAPEADVVFEPSLAEATAVRRLMVCDFVYAMYPFDRASEVFSRTSLPTKLATYVQAQRPILGHAPESSTLAAFLREHPVGVIAASEAPEEIARALEVVSALAVPAGAWERVRHEVYGHGNVERLHRCLLD